MVLNADPSITTSGRKQHKTSVAPPPRTLNVQKFAESRASELQSLHLIVSDRLNNDFRSRRNKRRRTTGFDNRVTKNKGRKRQKLGAVGESKSKVFKDKIPRHIRRKAELKKNPETGFCTSGDGTRRLRTHVWHAKRFTMTKLWGFYLPLGLHGKGKGSRSILKRFKNGSLVHDASYYGAVQLEGPEDSLLSVLDMVLVPSPSVLFEDHLNSVLSGVTYGTAMLHHLKANVPHSVAPVTYMWRPFHQQNKHVESDSPNSNGMESPSCRQMWIWVHASAFSEGYDALKFACEKQMNETGILINCLSRQGEFAKLEVMGSKSFQLLQKILQPETGLSAKSWNLIKCSVQGDTENHNIISRVLDSEECMPSLAIMSLTVDDPRSLPKNKISVGPEATLPDILSNLPEDETTKKDTLTEISNKEQNLELSLQFKHEEIDHSALWDTTNVISPPIEENLLCMEKHSSRLDSFCLGNTNSGALNDSTNNKPSRSCPILLLKDTNQKGSHTRWSIILPISWAKAFWIPLVSNGGHAVGLTEKHWIANDLGLPYFPSDFADSSAYTCFKATEAAASDIKAERIPLNKRPLRVPTLPPWGCVRFAFDEVSTSVSDSHPIESILSSELNVVPFEGFVARTSSMLTNFCNEICGDHLPLFPFPSERKISNFIPSQNGITQLNKHRKLCFIRVVLRAYKEGVFEEGAVVCAPQPTDIKLWISRLENNYELQVPQSSLSSYFTEQSSGIWEYNIPDDPVSRESHRWPIGFVTSGFVRGSKKPTAIALCEATSLGCLREEQWKEIPSKKRRKDIFVLVRNLRSTAYRLAVAAIVLEQQGEDLEFM